MYTNDKDLKGLIGVHAPFFNENENDKNMKNSEKPQKKNYTYKPQFGLVIILQSEAEQIEMFNKLQRQGLTLKVVTV